jgi:hypothetical protein
MLVQALEGAQSLGAADRGESLLEVQQQPELRTRSARKGGTASVPSDSFSFFRWQREKWDGTEPVPPLDKAIQMPFLRPLLGRLDHLRRVRPSS